MDDIIDLPEPLVFDWDEHNRDKIRLRHNIMPAEAEQPFLSDYAILFDGRHSIVEKRYRLVGPSNKGQILFIIFTIRNNKIRIISARSANRKERSNYGKKT